MGIRGMHVDIPKRKKTAHSSMQFELYKKSIVGSEWDLHARYVRHIGLESALAARVAQSSYMGRLRILKIGTSLYLLFVIIIVKSSSRSSSYHNHHLLYPNTSAR